MTTIEPNWDLLAIYFGIIAFFGGLVIPLYYGLAIDLLEEVTQLETDPSEKGTHARSIRSYLWATDFVVYSMGLLGAAGVAAGALIANHYCHQQLDGVDHCSKRVLLIVTIYCWILTILGSATLVTRWHENNSTKNSKGSWQAFVVGFIIALIVLGFWWALVFRWIPDLVAQPLSLSVVLIFVGLVSLVIGVMTHFIVTQKRALLAAVIGLGLTAALVCDSVFVFDSLLGGAACSLNESMWPKEFMRDTLFLLAALYLLWLALAAVYKPMTSLYVLKKKREGVEEK